jgi:DNA-binding CsgD family transcriptional regulator
MLLNSLRLAIDLLCFATGVSGILLAVLVYLRTPSRLIAHHALTLGFWTLNQFLLTAFFYLNAILGLTDPPTNAAINDVSYCASAFFGASLIYLLHAYFRKAPDRWMKTLAIANVVAAFIPTSLLRMAFPDLALLIGILEAAKLVLFYAALVAVAWQLHRFAQNVVTEEIRRILNILVLIQIVFYPIMLWEGSGFFEGHFFVPVSSFSLFYCLINLLWLWFVSRHIEFPVVQFVNEDRSLERFLTLFAISEREREITVLLLDGHSYKEIASRLFIAHETVKTHVNNIYKKAGVGSKMALARVIKNC